MISLKDVEKCHSREYITHKCDYCGKKHRVLVKAIRGRLQKERKFSRNFYCSNRCSAKYTNRNKEIKYIEKVCEGCGKTFKMRDNKRGRVRRFCSRKCADKNRHTEEVREKLSNSAKKIQGVEGIDYEVKISASGRKRIIRLGINKCIVCGKVFYGKRNKKTCSEKCLKKKNKKSARKAGKISAAKQVRRSKAEIELFDLLSRDYDCAHNEPIFNGWDADIIIHELRLAILWNGAWHYQKILDRHNLERVKERDKIKLKEIRKLGYFFLIVKDHENKMTPKKAYQKTLDLIASKSFNLTIS